MDDNVSIDDVKEFWENNPLFGDEGDSEIGSKQWFHEDEIHRARDCFPAGPDAIFTNGLTDESKILDVGCGNGFWTRFFLRKGFVNISACDLTEKAIMLTKKSLEIFNLKTNGVIIKSNAEALDFDDGAFDHVNCQGVIHHTPDTKKCLEEFNRVLRKGGTACFSVYHKNFILRSPLLLKVVSGIFKNLIGLKGRGRERMLDAGDADELVRIYDGDTNPLGKCYTLKEINNMVEGLFEIEEHQLFFFPARAFPIKLPAWLHLFLHKHFGFMIAIKARKI